MSNQMHLIMENWNRTVLRERLLNDRDYVESVLGIPFSLNESSQKAILVEQLLMEGFWDTLKSLPGKMKDLMLAVQTMTSNPGRIGSYLRFITDSISEKLKNIQSFLDKVRTFIGETPGLKGVADLFLKAINLPLKSWESMKNGWWKGVVGLGVVVILNMIVKRLAAMGWEALGGEEILAAIGEGLWEKLKELADEQVIAGMMDMASGGVSRFVKLLIDVVGTISDVLEPLQPIFELIKDATLSLSKAATGLALKETII